MDKQVVIDGYPYELTITGSGQPTWVFFHGFLGSSDEFSTVSPKGTCVYLNLKGFGTNAPKLSVADLSVERQMSELTQLFKELALPKVNLVGYSMGARLAIAFTIAHPELINHLYIESGTAGLALESDRVARQNKDEGLAERIENEGLEKFVDMWEKLPLFDSQNGVSKEKQQKVREQRLKQMPGNMANSLRAFGTGTMPNFWPVLSEQQVQTTIITGELDDKFTHIGQEMNVELPFSEHVVIPNVGHNVHLEKPLAFTNVLREHT